MKHIIHTPTGDFAYVESEFDHETGLEFEAPAKHAELVERVKSLKPGFGLDPKQFNALLDSYLLKGTVENGAEVWAQMDEKQQWMFQELKKSFKRTNK